MAETTKTWERRIGKEREEEWKKNAMEKVITRNMKHEGKLLGALATPMNRMSAKLTSPWRMFLDGSRNEKRCLKKKKRKRRRRSRWINF